MDDQIRFAYIFIFYSSFFMLHGALALFTEGLPGLYQNWGMGEKMNRQTAHPCESFFDEMIENCASSGHFIDFFFFFFFQNFVQLERWIFFGVSLFSLERSSVRQSRE